MRRGGDLGRDSHAGPIDVAIDCAGARASVQYLMDHTKDIVSLFAVQREPYTFEGWFVGLHQGLKLFGYPGRERRDSVRGRGHPMSRASDRDRRGAAQSVRPVSTAVRSCLHHHGADVRPGEQGFGHTGRATARGKWGKLAGRHIHTAGTPCSY